MKDEAATRRPVLAVSGVAFDGRGRVLLVRRSAPPKKGLWSVPGGKVEWGETLEQALIREFREETSLEVRIGPQVAVLERLGRSGRQVSNHYVIIDYLVHVDGGRARAGSDAAELLWVAPSHMTSLETTSGLLPIIRRAWRLRLEALRELPPSAG